MVLDVYKFSPDALAFCLYISFQLGQFFFIIKDYKIFPFLNSIVPLDS